MERPLFYYEVIATPLLVIPLIYLLIRIKMSRLVEHSSTFYHFFVWMEILSIAFIIINAISVALQRVNMGDLEYIHTLLLYFLRLFFLSSSLIAPLLAAAAVPKSTRMWDDNLFRLLFVLSLLLPAIVHLPTLILTKDSTLERIDIRNIDFTFRLISFICSSLLSLGAVTISITGAVKVQWTGESKVHIRERNCVLVGGAAALAHVMESAMQALNLYAYIMNNVDLLRTVEQSCPLVHFFVFFLPPLILILLVSSIRDALRGRTKTARRLSLLP